MSEPRLFADDVTELHREVGDDELARHPLPCDVHVGAVIFKRGVPLLDLVRAMRAYQLRAWPDKAEPPAAGGR